MSARSSSLLSQTPSSRRPPFQSRGSSSLASQVSPASRDGTYSTPQRKKGGPSLSLALSTNTSPSGHSTTADGEQIHPLKYTWDVWFSQRQGNAKNGKKDEQGKNGTNGTQKEKESREDWEGGVVKLGGFSSIESLHPFLAHLVPPSQLPGSLHTTHTLFSPSSSSPAPPVSHVICDYNVFRSSIAPAWEDDNNVGGGRWVVRLRKGVADRVWEEVVYALVSERIGGEDERAGEKVNGVVLSVRKDEDILSVWLAPSSRTERDVIRESLRTALSPLLTSTSTSNLQLDYKPHPVVGSGGDPTPTSKRLTDLSLDSPSASPIGTGRTHHLQRRGDGERRSHSGISRRAEGGLGEGEAFGTPLSERRSLGGLSRGGSGRGDSPSSNSGGGGGFGSYVPRVRNNDDRGGESSFERIERRVRESSPAGVIGGGAFGRSNVGVRSREGSGRAEEDRWGRL
ncbi:hypothetical protein NBRC10512_005000 [Rhodotorula toruloides]|uniref:RHTO0S01e14708g1_1 n=2 Tax=Rhodotorula toruloides TaxID=5286 RepID=A0A061ALB3_RHOTO|nr:translation initiation factor eIF-4E [Rhodotorula toruloides NP11]EMS24433.1 translation initiation factor eIF-4E [Rhodotorula toruloides NP11]CDR36121.1 RHTO0S01e14708g1_1 [Rhodotorula toruloides]